MDGTARDLGEFSSVDDGDADGFVSRLDGMHALDGFRSYKDRAYALLRLGPGARLADVGSGTGDDAARLAALVGPTGSVTGFDVSRAMVAEARARHAGVPGLAFAAAPGHDLPVADGSLDAIRCDRVLIHLAEPAACLAEMARCVRPGGRVVASEPDMPGAWIAAEDHGLAGTVMAAIAGSCASPHLPRDLTGLFRDAGLSDPELLVSPVPVTSRAAIEHLLRVSEVLDGLVAAGAVDAGRAARFSAEQAAREAAGRYLCVGCVVTVSATKR